MMNFLQGSAVTFKLRLDANQAPGTGQVTGRPRTMRGLASRLKITPLSSRPSITMFWHAYLRWTGYWRWSRSGWPSLS